ncbi:hypothetical protein A2165_00220 [Candidatus Curtissbacteria bacterium RBG_13_40_7]|uniref:TrbC/VIRB2 family protein n=1 Tax=Candidatus Curtissbacteria bacterium RBG_13_40_7 TaxID=1797706 RepID=A0A1F5FWC7_9BACT|nr:MAG: hypothetical protein A2165_00220 [Candidatus Curtissbacteria bacterium RBG_13_40_7]
MGYILFLAGYLLLLAPPVYADEPKPLSDLVVIVENIIKLLAPAAGIAFFIMLLVGGFQFITSGGDPKSVGGAKNTLTYAVIGIILVAVVWLVLVLIQTKTGVSVTNVELPGVE